MKTFTLYTASWCNPCKELKTWMVAKGIKIELTHVDIDLDPEAANSASVEKVPTMKVQLKGSHGFQLLEGREEIKPYLEHLNGIHSSQTKSKMSD